jgi:hypothetical protein
VNNGVSEDDGKVDDEAEKEDCDDDYDYDDGDKEDVYYSKHDDSDAYE